MPSLRARFMSGWLRRFEKPHLRRANDPVKARARLDWQARVSFRMPRDVAVTPGDIAGLSAAWARPSVQAAGGRLLYLHGGGYTTGSSRSHAALTAALAQAAGTTGVVPDYRLVPEHPFPAALEDAVAAYQALLETKLPVAIAGDSAGGGLALALLHEIAARRLTLPAAVLALSPWTDLTCSSDSLTRNRDADCVLPGEKFPEIAARYLAGADARDPRASPVFGTFPAEVPVLVQVSSTEVLYDDALAVERRLNACGAPVTVQTYDGLPHVWQLFDGWFPEAREAIAAGGAFLGRHLAAQAPT